MNNAGASGVVVDEEGLRAMNIDPSSWVLFIVFLLIHSDIFVRFHVNWRGEQNIPYKSVETSL